jgi:hypothetical protein
MCALTKLFSQLYSDRRGTAVTEFVVVGPLFLAVFLGILEVSLQLYYAEAAEKAAQLGARTAIVVTPAAAVPAINDRSASGQWGQPCAPTSDPCAGFAAAECTGAACGGAFAIVLARMQAVLPVVTAANVRLRYEYVAIGFAGGPAFPSVTLTLTGLTWPAGPFAAVRGLLGGTGASATMPDIRVTLTGEDLAT